jgi:hypothetical protein
MSPHVSRLKVPRCPALSIFGTLVAFGAQECNECAPLKIKSRNPKLKDGLPSTKAQILQNRKETTILTCQVGRI